MPEERPSKWLVTLFLAVSAFLMCLNWNLVQYLQGESAKCREAAGEVKKEIQQIRDDMKEEAHREWEAIRYLTGAMQEVQRELRDLRQLQEKGK